MKKKLKASSPTPTPSTTKPAQLGTCKNIPAKIKVQYNVTKLTCEDVYSGEWTPNSTGDDSKGDEKPQYE